MKNLIVLCLSLSIISCMTLRLPSTSHHYNRGRANVNDSLVDVGIGIAEGPDLTSSIPAVPKTASSTASDSNVLNPTGDENSAHTWIEPNIALGSNFIPSSRFYVGYGSTSGLFGMYDWLEIDGFSSTLAVSYRYSKRTGSVGLDDNLDGNTNIGTENIDDVRYSGRLNSLNETVFASYKFASLDDGLILIPYFGLGFNQASITVKNESLGIQARETKQFMNALLGIQAKISIFEVSYEKAQTQYSQRNKKKSFIADQSLLLGLSFSQ